MQRSIQFDDCFKLIHKEKVLMNFTNIGIYYQELEFIRTHLVKQEISRILIEKKKHNVKIENCQPLDPNTRLTIPRNLEFSLPLSLFLKCYLFIWRQCLDEFLIILSELNFIYTKSGMRGGAPNRKFSIFLQKFMDHKYDHLDDKIVNFLNKNIEDLSMIRFVRNNLKNNGKSLVNYSFKNERFVVMMIHNFEKIDDETILKYFKPVDSSDSTVMWFDLEKYLDKYSRHIGDFNILLMNTLVEKCLDIKYRNVKNEGFLS